MAGLLAARVLTDTYETVTIVERDALPDGPAHRRGVPQGHHTHGLLASGRAVLESLFPGIEQELVARGALANDIANDSRWFFEGACLQRFDSGLRGLLMTRPLLESVVRARVIANPRIRVCDAWAVESLVASADRTRVTGIMSGGRTIHADLVVDATGRGSRSAVWLESLGYERPMEESVHVALGYATRFFRRRATDLGGDTAVVVPPTPVGKRGGVMLAQEGDRWTVTLIAHFGGVPPDELGAFVEFARTLPAPFIHDVVSRADPIGDGASTRFPASVRRRYERLARFPEGYVVFGDAICSFNPIYGQGMSVAALQAIELQKTVAEARDEVGRRFFRRAARVVDIPWSIAAGSDLRMPETVGRRGAGVSFVNWYMAKLHQAAHRDPVAALAFHRVSNLLAPPPTVMHPRVALRVLLAHLGVRSRNVQSGRVPPAVRTRAGADAPGRRLHS